MFGGFLSDVRFALRLFRRQPAIVVVTAVGLAVTIGFSTLVFSFLGAEWLRPLPVDDPETLLQIQTGPRVAFSGWTYEEYVRLREGLRLVRSVATTSAGGEFRRGDTDGEGERVQVWFVDEGFFPVMGATAAVGRLLGPGDHAPDAEPAVVLNHTYWQQRLDADESVVGRVISIGGASFTVVGVADPSFGGPTPYPPPFWAPLAVYGHTLGPALATASAESELSVQVYGRLREGATIEQAQAELDVLTLVGATGAEPASRPTLTPADFRSYGGGAAQVAVALSVVLTVLVLLLLVAGANVASLLLASAVARQREIGIRLALGAGRMRIVRQLLTESLLLGAMGGAAGLLLASWGLALLQTRLPAGGVTVSRAPDARALGFAVLVSVVVGIFAGLAPARYGAGGNVASPLAGGESVLGRGMQPRRARKLLVATQAAVSSMMLVVTALLMVAAVHLARFDYGIDVDRLVTVTSSFRYEDIDVARARAYWAEAGEVVSRLQDVEGAALVRTPPFRGYVDAALSENGRQAHVSFNWSTAEWFDVVGLRFVAGRGYTAQEVATGSPVVVVSESVARDLWPGDAAVGAVIDGSAERISGTQPGWRDKLHQGLDGARVIGIVTDATTDVSRGTLSRRAIYLPMPPDDAAQATMVVRTRAGAGGRVAGLQQALRAVDPKLRPTVVTVRAELTRATRDSRSFALIAAVTASIALVLAVTGVFGLAAFLIERRAAEIGLRIALGAGLPDVIRLMLRDSLSPVLQGATAGTLLAVVVGRTIVGSLYGVSATDPRALAGAFAAIATAAALAAIAPTRRIANLEPVAALRRR